MDLYETNYCRVNWNNLIKITFIDPNKIHFRLGCQRKGSDKIEFNWEYLLNLELYTLERVDSYKNIILPTEVKYNLWNSERSKKIEELFPLFIESLRRNYKQADLGKIIIHLFPFICSYDLSISQSKENKLFVQWVENKLKDSWD
jgi:hypothetical protein